MNVLTKFRSWEALPLPVPLCLWFLHRNKYERTRLEGLLNFMHIYKYDMLISV